MVDSGRRFDWASVRHSQSLADGKLPIPTVTWTAPGFRLDTTLLADSSGRAALARYALTNIAGPRADDRAAARRPPVAGQSARAIPRPAGRLQPDLRDIVRTNARLAITQPQTEGDPPVTRDIRSPADCPTRRRSAPCPARTWPPPTCLSARPAPGRERGASSWPCRRASGAAPSWSSAFASTQAHWRDVLGRRRRSRAAGQAARRRHADAPRSRISWPAARARCSGRARAATPAPGSATGR